jgi:ribonuclease BN (tRNA processing enzyme)
MNVVILGSGGWIPTSRRETCSAYVREGTHVLLLDAGTGIKRLIENPELLQGVEHVDIVLTHFHLDHVVGLSYLPALLLAEPPTIWGPGKVNFGSATVDILDRLLGPPLFAASTAELSGAVRELGVGDHEIGPLRLATRVQELHTCPTLAVRLGDELTLCTDTAADAGNVEFAAGTRLLLHEAWHAARTSDDTNHSASGEAARVARDACAERLVLIHVNPLQLSDEELLRDARAEFPAACVGLDLMQL